MIHTESPKVLKAAGVSAPSSPDESRVQERAKVGSWLLVNLQRQDEGGS